MREELQCPDLLPNTKLQDLLKDVLPLGLLHDAHSLQLPVRQSQQSPPYWTERQVRGRQKNVVTESEERGERERKIRNSLRKREVAYCFREERENAFVLVGEQYKKREKNLHTKREKYNIIQSHDKTCTTAYP